MKAASASTNELDPYRAGVELADTLAAIEPEIVFLNTSIDYFEAGQLTDAIYDVLGNDKLLLIGCSGEGYLETSRVADVGACALGLNFGGAVRMRLASDDATGDSQAAMGRCLAALTAPDGRKPDLLYMVCDFRHDGTAVEKAIQEYGVPLVGGLAGDNMLEMKRCAIFRNREALSAGMVVLGLEGNFAWRISLGHEMTPVGNEGTVTATDNVRVLEIDGIAAADFMCRAVGRPVSRIDQGNVTLNVLDKNIPEQKYLRAIVTDTDRSDGSFTLFGSIPNGSQVRVCIAQPDSMIKDVYRIAAATRDCGFLPRAGLIVSCAGRKHLLGNRIEHEVNAVRETLGDSVGIVGYPSFGEFSPVPVPDGYSPTFFHNMTYVLLLLGDRS